MHQANFFTASTMSTNATRATQATRPLAATAASAAPLGATRATTAATATAGFGSMFSQVQNEVGAFISKGGGSGFTATAGATLSPEGLAYLERSQPASALASINAGGAVGTTGSDGELQQQFLASIKPWTEETGQRLGVAPELVAAHAALESGWGRRPLLKGDGNDTNNLFGIKAGAKWTGEVADNLTTEYTGGAALKKTERFRSYPDQASAFRDYAQVLLDNPRFKGALGTGADAQAFAQGLARGGYATDPAYADKLSRLASRLQQK